MKIINAETVANLISRAAASPRKRMNFNLHTELSDPVNRFLNAGLAGTYVRPHRHQIDKWELVGVLQGSFDVVLFAPNGVIKNRFKLGLGDINLAEIPGGDWHSIVFRAPAAVVLEVKPGPYEPQLDKEFAEWAPAENDPAAGLFVSWLERAGPGDKWSA
jgi:cupin fold WbuC family metalloprotein